MRQSILRRIALMSAVASSPRCALRNFHAVSTLDADDDAGPPWEDPEARVSLMLERSFSVSPRSDIVAGRSQMTG